jgi:hypothetical protein
MSHFSDFDEYLSGQDKEKAYQKSQYRLLIQQSRAALDPFLRTLFTLFKEYNETILQPRKEHFVILKKQEEIPENYPPKEEQHLYFLYRVNVLPRILFAQQFNPLYAMNEDYITPNKITRNDWYLKVALQFDTLLSDIWNEKQHSFAGTLLPTVRLRAWGVLDEQKTALLSSRFCLSVETAWRKTYTTLSLNIINPLESDWEQEVKELFMLITPLVFSHTREVYGLDI